MNKPQFSQVIILVLFLFGAMSTAYSQKSQTCKTKDYSGPKYTIGKWERRPPNRLFVYVGLRSSKIDEDSLVKLSSDLEERFCRETSVTFWIFDDFRWATDQIHDDAGFFWPQAKKSSIAGYSFDRVTGENLLSFRLEGNEGFVGYESQKVRLASLRSLKP